MVPAKLIRANPKNWRTHPDYQKGSVRRLLEIVGWMSRVTVYTHPDGTLEIVNGHLRADIADDDLIPVDFTDLSPAEADLMLATMDQTTSLAGVDPSRHRDLLAGLTDLGAPLVEVGYPQLQLNDILSGSPYTPPPGPDPPPGDPGTSGGSVPVTAAPKSQFQILITCKTEAEQAAWLVRLAGEGLACRSLIS